MITEKQKKFIIEHIEKDVSEKLIEYLSRNIKVGKEIFSYIGEDYRYYEYHFEDITIDKFIPRIIFYFYKSTNERRRGDLQDYIIGIEGCKLPEILEKNFEYILEKLFDALEILHYKYNLELKDIFEYPFLQTQRYEKTNVLFNWLHYLELSEKYNLKKLKPENLLIEYNQLLECENMHPNICCVREHSLNYRTYTRGRNGILLKGKFPCDKNNKVIFKWIGIKMENVDNYQVEVDQYFRGELFLKIKSNSEIWVLDQYCIGQNNADYWDKIYTGPLKTFFDFSIFKLQRKRRKYTQQEVSKMIDANLRTYQKWESGESVPDGHFLLRLINLYDIDDINLCLRREDNYNIKESFLMENYYLQFANIIINREKYEVKDYN